MEPTAPWTDSGTLSLFHEASATSASGACRGAELSLGECPEAHLSDPKAEADPVSPPGPTAGGSVGGGGQGRVRHSPPRLRGALCSNHDLTIRGSVRWGPRQRGAVGREEGVPVNDDGVGGRQRGALVVHGVQDSAVFGGALVRRYGVQLVGRDVQAPPLR